MKDQKTAIVGGGICGLYLAWKLSEKGVDTTVFEKNREIGKQACSGLFSERILDFIPQSEQLVQNKIEYALLHFPKKTIRIEFSKKFLVMEHCELDRLVASLAEESGAKIVLDRKISSISEGFDRIIGCDGAVSQIREYLGLKDPRFRLGIQGFISERDGSNFVDVWPTRSGFVWKIPRGEEIEYGVIEKRDTAKEILDKFLKKRSIHLERINSAIIPQGLIVSSDNKITLCGDSAGLTKPWSGGGVIWSLIAADILLREFPNFLEYKKELKKFFLPRIVFSKIVTKLAYFLGFNVCVFLPKNVKIESDFLL